MESILFKFRPDWLYVDKKVREIDNFDHKSYIAGNDISNYDRILNTDGARNQNMKTWISF